MVQSDVFTPGKYEILKKMHDCEIDFRMLDSIKNALFDS